MTMLRLVRFFLASCCLGLALGFVIPAADTTCARSSVPKQSSSPSQLAPRSSALYFGPTGIYPEVDPAEAAVQFYFFFFAGSGAGGIGLAQVPRITGEFKMIRDLAAQGPAEGGPPLAALTNSPVYKLFYPQPLSEKDVRKVLAKVPTSAKITAQGTSKSYFAAKGYVVQEDFLTALKGCNPLATYATFEALSSGSGKCISPDEVDAKMAEYRKDIDAGLQQFAKDVQGACLKKLSAYGTLAFLLFVAFDLIVESGIAAFL